MKIGSTCYRKVLLPESATEGSPIALICAIGKVLPIFIHPVALLCATGGSPIVRFCSTFLCYRKSATDFHSSGSTSLCYRRVSDIHLNFLQSKKTKFHDKSLITCLLVLQPAIHACLNKLTLSKLINDFSIITNG